MASAGRTAILQDTCHIPASGAPLPKIKGKPTVCCPHHPPIRPRTTAGITGAAA